jgi:hypothetical protein
MFGDYGRGFSMDRGTAMLDLLSTPVEMLWLAVAFVAIMAGMLAAAPE